MSIKVKSQFEFLYSDPSPNKVIACCRGGGKTWAVCDWLVDYLIKSSQPVSAIFFSPTLKQVKKTVEPIMMRHLESSQHITYNKSELVYNFKRKSLLSSMHLLSYENADSKRGLHPDVVILDEVADCSKSMWELVILPMLVNAMDRGTSRIIAIGTPQGKNQFWDLFQKGRDKGSPNWSSYMLKADTSGLFSPNTLWQLKNSMSKAAYAQEMNCDFNANVIIGSVYGDFFENYVDKFKHIDDSYGYDSGLPVWTAWDLGHSNQTSIWFFQVKNNVVTFIDFYENSGFDTSHYAGVLLSKPYVYANAILPWDAGINNIRSPLSISEQISNFGIKNVVLSNKSVSLGIDKARQLLKVCRFNKSNCSTGIEHLKLYRYKINENTGVQFQTPLHDLHSDAADAFRYAAVSDNVWNFKQNCDNFIIKGQDYNVLY